MRLCRRKKGTVALPSSEKRQREGRQRLQAWVPGGNSEGAEAALGAGSLAHAGTRLGKGRFSVPRQGGNRGVSAVVWHWEPFGPGTGQTVPVAGMDRSSALAEGNSAELLNGFILPISLSCSRLWG